MATFEEARANSLRIYFGPGKKEPLDHGIFNFMKQKMRLNPNSLLSMYKESKENCVYIKFKTEEMLTNTLLDLPESMDFEYNKYESTKVTFSSASTVFKYVRIFNLPPEISDQEISTVMSKFGVIQRMVRERYAPETGFPIWSSVRGVHMEIKQDIPATIHVRNFQARVYYDGLQNKCFICGSKDHVKVNCPKKSKVNQRMEQNGSLSYSAVTAKPPLWLGRGSTHKAGESGGEGQMVVLNNFFGPAKPSLLVPPKLPEVPSAVKPIVQAGVGSSSVEQIVLPMSEPDAEMKETTTAEGVLTGGGVSSLAVPIVTDGAVKEAQGEEEFQLVQGRKKKRKEEMRSLSADAPAKPGSGMIFIPPSNLSAAQSMETRGRSKKKEDNKERSRSRSLRDRDTEGKGDTRGKGDVKGKDKLGGNGEGEGVDANLEENL